jgi:hypothetical protein
MWVGVFQGDGAGGKGGLRAREANMGLRTMLETAR